MAPSQSAMDETVTEIFLSITSKVKRQITPLYASQQTFENCDFNVSLLHC